MKTRRAIRNEIAEHIIRLAKIIPTSRLKTIHTQVLIITH